MTEMIRETFSADETFELGRELGSKAQKGQIFALTGDLGTGKTVFAQGFAAGLGINEHVNSPTFTILQVYEGGRLPLYHFDVYRIEDPDEMFETGYEDCFYGDGVTLVEWAGIIEEMIPDTAVKVDIIKDPASGADYRRIEINGLE